MNDMTELEFIALLKRGEKVKSAGGKLFVESAGIKFYTFSIREKNLILKLIGQGKVKIVEGELKTNDSP